MERLPRLYYWTQFFKEMKEAVNEIEDEQDFAIFLMSMHESIESYIHNISIMNKALKDIPEKDMNKLLKKMDDKYESLDKLIDNIDKEVKEYWSKNKETKFKS